MSRRLKRLPLLLAAVVMGAAQIAQAAIIDLGGSTQSISNLDTAQYGGVPFAGNTVVNGILDVSGLQTFGNNTYTFGAGLVLNQGSSRWTISGGRQVHVVNGCVVNLNTDDTINYFGRCWMSNGWNSWGNQTKLILNNGTFNCASHLHFSPIANANTDSRNIELYLLMTNGSSLTLGAGKELKFGVMDQADGKKHITEKITVAVTNSTISAGKIHFGSYNNYMTSQWNGFINVSFGPGADITCRQFYPYRYPKSTIVFDGATVRTASTVDPNFFGLNLDAASAKAFDGYQLRSGGLTFDVTVGFTHGTLFAPLFGPGGFTKTGSGSLTYNCDAFMFTGPLTVSNGTFISTQKMAASAFNVDGASSVLQLSGALTNATVSLSATAGGTLTLAGATISDTSPDLTLAGGSTTDYFTRDGVVGAYTLDSLTLGPGAVVDIDADATATDAINATTTSVTATAESKATININFTDEPARGTTFPLFETDSADKFTVVPKLGSRILRHKESVVAGRLVLTVNPIGLVIMVM